MKFRVKIPTVRKQVAGSACWLGRQAGQDILQIDQRVMAIEFGRLDHAHDRGGAFGGEQTSGK